MTGKKKDKKIKQEIDGIVVIDTVTTRHGLAQIFQ